MPFVSPVTTKGLAVPVAFCAPHVAVKVAAVPPLVEAVKTTVICVAPAVTEVILGVPGFTVAAAVAVMLYFCNRVVPVVGVVVGQTPDVAAERWMKPA